MKTSIIITGQIQSLSALKGAISTNKTIEIKNLPYHGVIYTFKTKKEAVKELSSAYQYLRSDKEDWEASNGSYLYSSSLSYDAGNARIVKT